MGLFSHLTADTGESVLHVHSDGPVRTAYLLQPGGEAPIEEPAYTGYGRYGGVDLFEWIGRRNLPAATLADLDGEAVADLGATLALSGWLEDEEGGRHAVGDPGAAVIDPTIVVHGVGWDQPIAAFGGATANEMVADGRLTERPFDVAFPLKISFDRHAVYEDLPASPDCPRQGFAR